MRRVYLVLAGLMFLATVVQLYFAAVGAFAKPQDDGSYALHMTNGMMVIPLLSILATVAAALARAPGHLVGLTIVPLGLIVVQALIVVLGQAFNDGDRTTPVGLAIMGLHALGGVAVIGVAATVFRRARQLSTTDDSALAASTS